MAAAIKNNSKNGKVTLFSHLKYEHMVAGVSGGVTSTLILHPLDLIKIRFAGEFGLPYIQQSPQRSTTIPPIQTNNFLWLSVNDGRSKTAPQYRSMSGAFITIFQTEGFRGLYKGVTPNVWGSGSAWGFYFLL